MVEKLNRRLGNRKTSTGCITCKIRRIKCDEGRPSCRRCTTTGRQCDGYRQQDIFRNCMSTHYTETNARTVSPVVSLNLDEDESRTLQFFTEKAAPSIAGWANVDFWARIVPQLSQSHEAIRHAAIAIGSLVLHSQSTLSSCERAATTSMSRVASQAFALRQYGKAIKTTLDTIKEGRGGPDLATVTCLLFVCVEALQGHEREAISLFQQGQTALMLWSNMAVTDDTSWQIAPTPVHTDIRGVFDSLAQQFMMFGGASKERADIDRTAFISPLPVSLPCMSSLEEARDRLLHLLNFAQSIASVGNDIKWLPMDSDASLRFVKLYSRQHDVDCALQIWHQQFRDIVQSQRSKDKLSAQQQVGISMLVQQYHIIRVWLAGSLEVSECFYDKFMPQFQVIIDAATSLAGLAMQAESKKAFCIDMGSIPPLYWTALKCRNPILRRRALSLLSNNERQEGLWDSRISSKVARRVVQLEEGISDDELVMTGDDHENSTVVLPPEANRIKAVQINLRCTNVDGQQGDLAEFYLLSEGPTRGWYVKKEFIAL